MSYWEAILLGIIQGATEFLPISSSGHLILVPSLLGWTEPPLTLVAIAHLGTLVAVLIYFRRDLWQITKAVLAGLGQRAPMATPDARLGWYILAGTIPAGAAGLLLESFFDEVFGIPVAAAFFLLVTAALLVVGERLLTGRKQLAQLKLVDAVIIGLFQMVALLPGVSRSGSTITGGLWRGLDRPTAARFSFLLGIPAILGAGLLAVLDLAQAGTSGDQLPFYLVTFATAALTGYACIYFLLAWLRQRSLYIFAAYCAVFGSVYLLLAFAGLLPA